MTPISADSREGRLLLALRRGPHEPGELAEQFGKLSGLQGQLMRAGLIAYNGDTYTLTDAGRAACPFRNPLAAKAAVQPEVFIMPKGETHVTRQQVLAVILAGGAAGATRKQLIEKFAGRASEQGVEMHMSALHRQKPAVVFKPKAGVLVGIQFANATPSEPAPAPAEIAQETASTGAEDWIPEPLATDPPVPATYAVENLDVEQITARPIIFDTELEDPDQVEFCIFSSGGFEIMSEQGTIGLSAPVLAKLRAFLGLFQGEAA